MSLNWDAKDAPSWEKVQGYKGEEIVFASIPLGFSKLTMDNYREMYARYIKLMRCKVWVPTLTLEDFHSAVGLHTNASAKTPAKFGKDLLAQLDEDIALKVRVEEEVGW